MRNLLSIITGLGLLGVALGVLVLVVVLAVMYGFEREVKERILNFTPHLILNNAPEGSHLPILGWQERVEQLEQISGVEEAYPYIQDNVVLDVNGSQLPVFYRAIDTTDEEQVAKLEKLIHHDLYGGSADMGLDEKAVISASTARQFQLQVGDTISLYSTRNFKEVFKVYKSTERLSVVEEYAEDLEQITQDIREKVVKKNKQERFLFQDLSDIIESLRFIHDEPIRDAERILIADAMNLLAEVTREEGNEDIRILKEGTVEQALGNLSALGSVDIKAEDDRALRNLKEVVLPKELEVVGVYRANQQIFHPAIFVPLNTGMELMGVTDGVSSLALRTSDPYKTHITKELVEAELGFGWVASSWVEQYSQFFQLIQTEKAMMSFVLSFIALGSAFSIMAVMIMFAMQKKREIGVLQALGARASQICWVFVFQGMITGLFGSLLGLGAAKLVIHYRGNIHNALRYIGIDPFPAGFHDMDTLPAYLTAEVAILAPLGAFVLCSLAPLIPALLASTRDPAKSLRDF